ncbi:hypothetical protein VNI00_007984 [Paramarasmius palmivorus]|uniref:NmrA-like domain-containing protein n=1 Tax=Paramarasmius palmivorus TaxID=297713 RepID=A0AAW0CVK0_9AGAR
MSQKVKILVTGVTGYIGGAVVDRFLARSDASSLDIRAIVRSKEKAEKLRDFGINLIVGSHNDENVMVKAASEVDVVIAMADSDDLNAAKYILRGLKKRFEETGKPPIFINTSGTGTLADNAAGLGTTDTIYDDADPDQIETLPPTQIHRNVDLEITNADKEAGISNPHSIQVPSLIKASLDRKRAGMVGQGKNVWPNVDIHELAELYNLLYDATINNPNKIGHGREGYYFGASGEHKLYDVSKAIGEALVELGISDNGDPTTFTPQEMKKYYNQSNYMENNSRCVANRSRALGWSPKKSTPDLLKSIKPEVEAWFKKGAAY